MPSPTPSVLEGWYATFPRYQLRWIFEQARVAVAVKARQIGFSHANAAAALRAGLFEGRPQIVLSASQSLSDELLAKVKAHCEILAALGMRAATAYTTCNTTEVAWKSGGRVIALPANPRTARSFSGDVTVDEAAYIQDLDGIRDAVFPIVSRADYRLRICSTPNGAVGLFHEWATATPPGWALHRVTIDEAIADGFPVDRAKLWELSGGDERIFAQCYLATFVDADLQYVPTALADAALAWPGAMPDLSEAELHAGLDVGREHDLTALTVVARHGRRAYVLAVLTCKRTDFAGQKRMIDDARRALGWASLTVDASGLGTQLAEELVERYGADEVRPVVFTADAKQNLATRVLRWLRDGRLRFARDANGRALHAETIALRRKVTASGNVQYVIPRTRAGHGDRFWSMALGLAGADGAVVPRGVGVQPVFAIA